MAFPTIPTVGAGRVLTTNQADTSATRTFPSLSSLTKNAGDLLIAGIITYQNGGSADANFSSWGGGFTEFYDQDNGAGTMSVGLAYKYSDGSETGTFTVTQAATVTGHASMFLISIPGASATIPEAGGIAWGTSAAADPTSFDPAGWAAEDTLWISLVGSGMTSGTGSWTGTATSAPTNYTDRVDSNTADNSTVGQTELALAFRQLNASAEDIGTAGVDTSNARNVALTIAVRPLVPVSGSFTADAHISGTAAGSFTADAHISNPNAPYHSDDFARTVSSGSGWGGDWLHNSSTALGVNGSRAYYTNTGSVSKISYVNGLSQTDVDITGELAIDDLPGTGENYSYAVVGRLQDTSNYYRVDAVLLDDGTFNLILRHVVGNTATSFGTTVNKGTYTAGETWFFRVQFEGTSPTTIRFKVWDNSSSEPGTWDREETDSTSPMQAAGSYGVRMLPSAATYLTTAYLDNWLVDQLASSATYSGSFTADAHISKNGIAGTFTADSNIRKNDIAGSFTADAYIKRLDNAGSFTADSHIKSTLAGSFVADAHIKSTVAGSFTADAYIKRTFGAGTGSGTPTLVQSKQGQNLESLTFDSATTAGNLLMAVTVQRDTGNGYTLPSGFSDSGAGRVTVIPGNARDIVVSYKVANGSESTINFAWANADRVNMYIAEFSGVDTATLDFLAQTPGSATTALDGGDFVLAGAGLLIGSFVIDTGATGAATPTSPSVEISDTALSGGFQPNLWAAYRVISTGGTYAVEGTGPNVGWASITLAFDAIGDSLTFTADAYISKTFSASFTADANIKSTIAGSFTADAHLYGTVAGSFTADAFIKKNDIPGSFTADAYISNTIAGSFTADAYVKQTFAQSFTADSFIRRNDIPGSFSADAYLKNTIAGSFSADAQIANAVNGSFVADAYIKQTFSASLTADAYIRSTLSGTFAADAFIRTTTASTFSADAYLLNVFGGSWTADAYIRNTFSQSFTADAHLAGTVASSFTADAHIAVTGVGTGSFTADANIRRNGIEASFTADAYILDTFEASFTADAYILKVTSGSFTADAEIEEAGATTYPGSFTADAHIQSTISQTFSANANISRLGIPGSFTGDAYIRQTFAGSLTADAYIKNTLSGSFSAAAFIFATVPGSFTADAYVRLVTTGQLTADAYIRQTFAGSFSADAYIRQTIGGAFTADSFIKQTFTASFDADAYIRQTYSGSMTADGHIAATVAGSFGAFAHISNPFAVLVVDSVTSQGPTIRVRLSTGVSLVGTVSQGPTLVARTEQE